MNDDILDQLEPKPEIERPNFKLSYLMLRVSLLFFAGILVLAGIFHVQARFVDMIAVPFFICLFGVFITSVIGLSYGIRSYIKKEPYLFKRSLVVVALAFICTFYGWFLYMSIVDYLTLDL